MKGKANSVNLFIYFLKPVNPGHAITVLFSAICLVIKRYYKVCLAEFINSEKKLSNNIKKCWILLCVSQVFTKSTYLAFANQK